jgi:hypothetical protein
MVIPWRPASLYAWQEDQDGKRAALTGGYIEFPPSLRASLDWLTVETQFSYYHHAAFFPSKPKPGKMNGTIRQELHSDMAPRGRGHGF